MQLTWRRSERAENRLEKWLAQRHQEQVLEGASVVPGPCPETAFLRDLAGRSNQISLADPRVDHVASCPNCMSSLLALRREAHSSRQKLVLAVAVASCVVIAAVVIALTRREVSKQSFETKPAVVSETVNLWEAGTLRGQHPGPLQSVSLPSSLIRLKIVLPRFSTPGEYEVAVTHDQEGSQLVADGTARAAMNGDRTEVAVDLDLRKAKPGSYFLSTTHEQDQASYYYPLQIK